MTEWALSWLWYWHFHLYKTSKCFFPHCKFTNCYVKDNVSINVVNMVLTNLITPPDHHPPDDWAKQQQVQEEDQRSVPTQVPVDERQC